MAMNLIYITNDPVVAQIAEQNGVQRIMIDLETLGKEERQKNMNTVKSHHTIADVNAVASVLSMSQTLVRINPWNSTSSEEVEQVIAAGADIIMLPMWKTFDEVDAFLTHVNRRVKTLLLLETKEAVEILDRVLEHPLVDEIHIGLNDLHLSYGLTFMFELLSNGVVEALCGKMKKAGIKYGFGGIARIGEGTLPAESIAMEHYRLGSSGVILSRSFCNTSEITDLNEIAEIFEKNIVLLRDYESTLPNKDASEFIHNQGFVKQCVCEIVEKIKEKQL